MKNRLFYNTDGLRTMQPDSIIRIEINYSSPIPAWVYIGSKHMSDMFEEYCIEKIVKEDMSPENFTIVDVSSDLYVCLICMPSDLVRFDNEIEDKIKHLIQDYVLTYYKIIEFDSYDNLRKYLSLCKKINEIKYDNKRKVFYYKISHEDCGLWPDYGRISYVDRLRYENCKIANDLLLYD